MAIRLTTSFVSTVRPGAYPTYRVRSTPTGIGATGLIAVIGEAEQGESFTNEVLANNSFTPDQTAQVSAKYGSGPIVDAINAMAAPSNDPDIVGAPNRIYVLKTNAGTKATAAVDTDYGTFSDKSQGVQGNQKSYRIFESQSEQGPSLESGIISALATAGATPEIFTVTTPASAGIVTGQYMTFQAGNNGQKYYLWFNKDAAGGDPAVAGRIGVEVAISTGDTASAVAIAVQAAIDALPTYAATVLSTTVTATAATNGEAENAANVNVTGLTVATTQQGGLVDASALNGLSFSVRQNGGVATVITLSATESDHDTPAELAAEIDAQLPAGLSCAAGTGNRIVISADVDAANHRKGWSKSFELIDSTPGDLAAISYTAGLVVSSQESGVQVRTIDNLTAQEETFEAVGLVAMSVGYAGTTATLTITAGGSLSTTVSGGAGASLVVDTTKFATIKSLAEFIASKPGYSAEADPTAVQLPTSSLDKVSAIGIAANAAGAKPGRIKRSMANFKAQALTSSQLDFTATDVDGLPAPTAVYQYLAGGTKGGTTGAAITNALLKLEGIKVNFVVPLFSRDASLDIADGLTDGASTYTLDSIHAAARSHCLKMANVKFKKNRQAWLSYKGTFAEAKNKVGNLASFRTSLCIQDVQQGSSVYQPWYMASVAAAMQAAGFYKAIFNKLVNITNIIDPADMDSGSPGDIEAAIEAGLLIAERQTDGVKFVSDQTTYGFDSNFVYNSTQAVYAADTVAVEFADAMQKAFVGKSLADVDAGVVLSEVSKQMDLLRRIKLIAASSDAPLGYRNVNITINGPIIYITLEIKLATAIYFIPIEIEFSAVQSSATA